MDPTGADRATGAEVLSVSCNHCGAPLSVPTGTRFLTCTYCGARLEVLLSGGAAYTQVLQNIDQRTERIEQDVAEIKMRERIEQLDREWEMNRQQYMVRDKQGNQVGPGGGIVMSIFGVVAGVIWMIFAASIGAPFPFPLFGLVFAGAAIAGGVMSTSKGANYRNAEVEYQRQRQAMMDELDQRPR
jgi:uncharacterized Zn finger protein (UPF0148 family)